MEECPEPVAFGCGLFEELVHGLAVCELERGTGKMGHEFFDGAVGDLPRVPQEQRLEFGDIGEAVPSSSE